MDDKTKNSVNDKFSEETKIKLRNIKKHIM